MGKRRGMQFADSEDKNGHNADSEDKNGHNGLYKEEEEGPGNLVLVETEKLRSSANSPDLFIYLFIYYFPTIKITQALHYTKMWRGDLRKPQGLYEEAPSLQ